MSASESPKVPQKTPLKPSTSPPDGTPLDCIRKAKSVWLTTHPQADGDGLACEAAMWLTLEKLGKSVKIMNFEPPGPKYRFLFEAGHLGKPKSLKVQVFDADLDPAPPDLIVLFDTNDFRLLEPMIRWREGLKASGTEIPILIVDHHQGAIPPDALAWVDRQAASSGEVLLAIIEQLLAAEGKQIDEAIASSLYTSLVFDTQNFRYIRSSPSSHKMAAALLPLISEPEKVHEALFANLTPMKLGFLAAALSALRIEAEGTLAVVILTRDLFQRYQAEANDSGDVVDMALNVSSVKVALLLRQETDDTWKISLRSKKGFSVLETAQNFGGGGHINAAGATVKSADSHSLETKIKPLLITEIRHKMGAR